MPSQSIANNGNRKVQGQTGRARGQLLTGCLKCIQGCGRVTVRGVGKRALFALSAKSITGESALKLSGQLIDLACK